MEKFVYEVGDIVKLKKQHPCGATEWEILRIGADFRLKCTGCGHQVMIARKLVEKNTKGLQKNEKNLQKKACKPRKNVVSSVFGMKNIPCSQAELVGQRPKGGKIA